jgi:uncharacterized membrane protein YtjA (UPF0391 family)
LHQLSHRNLKLFELRQASDYIPRLIESMAKYTTIFLVAAVALVLIGFSGVVGTIGAGFARALAGVALILFLIARLFGKELA